MPEEMVPFAGLTTADLVLDRVYSGGTRGHAGDDAIGKLLPVGNQGGFRFNGSVAKRAVKLVVLYTSGAEVDWPDHIEPTTGDFTYYGDNRKPGKDLHDTPRGGNELLRRCSRHHEPTQSNARPSRRSSCSSVSAVETSGSADCWRRVHPA